MFSTIYPIFNIFCLNSSVLYSSKSDMPFLISTGGSFVLRFSQDLTCSMMSLFNSFLFELAVNRRSKFSLNSRNVGRLYPGLRVVRYVRKTATFLQHIKNTTSIFPFRLISYAVFCLKKKYTSHNY